MKNPLRLSFRKFYSKNLVFVFAFLLVAFAASARDHYGAQTIEFTTLSNQTFDYVPFSLHAAASSGLPVTYKSSNAAVASAETTVSDFGIYKWNGIGWDNLPGVNAIRIAVDENGNPWVVNSNHDIYQYVNNVFIQRPGKANDIGIGGGQVWIIGVDPVGTDVDYRIYKWNGSGWDNLPGGGVRIAVDANGQPWVTNSSKNIYQYVNNAWLKLPGQANDIGIGGGSAWKLGTNSVGTGSDFGIYRWNGSDWINLPGGGVNITADENGQPWVSNSVKDIYQFVNGAWKKLPGQANDIGIGGGKTCIIGNVPAGEALTTPVLYGSTTGDGQLQIGSVFTSNLDGSELKSIYNFTTATSRRAIGSLVLGTDGFLYGMAVSASNNSGTIFKINADGSGYTELHNFNGYPSASSLIQTTDGAFFGMILPSGNELQGRVFKINADGSGYQDLQILGSSGEPGFLMQASNGSIYGTDASTGFGNIFRMNADGSGYTVLHNFNGSDGSFAYGALMEATDGSLYGAASQGGSANIGTIYKINKDGTGFTVLHNFYLSQEGVTPSESLAQAPDGSPYLYGMTLTGGQYNSGVIYKISMTGDGYTVLHTFSGPDGARPACKLIHVGNKLYGYTTNGGLNGGGVIFNYDLETSSYNKLADFNTATGTEPVFGGLLLMRPPTIDKPTVPASNISFSNILSTSMTVSFTPGNGSQHLVVMKAGAPPTFKPIDSTAYVMSQDLGHGETIVSIGNESTINVTGLNQLTRYYFTVFESAKDNIGTINYLIDNAPVASAETSASDFGVYKWDGIRWDNLPGVNAIRIAVDENGNPWVVNSNHDIYQYVNNAFIQRPGKANDIGIGGGQVWIIGVEPVRTDVDYKIYKWNGAGWDNLPGGGVRIAVDSNGQPWVTNSVKNIYRYVNNAWLLMPGLANDIGIGGGIAWILSTNSVGTGSDFGIYRWNGSDWINLPGGGVNITADENGQPWVSNSVKDIYQFVNGAWKKLPGQANDIGIGGGKACIIGAAPGANGIKNFSLINTATNEVLSSFEDSVTVDIAHVDFSMLVVRANTSAINLGSVSFLLDGVKTNTDNNVPYQVKKSAFQSLSTGSHWLLANVFTKRNGKGFEEASRGAVITIINSSAITHFDIVNTAGVVLQELHDNNVINIGNAAFRKITIVARVNNGRVGSVVFELNDVHHIENIAPYAFNGDHNGYYIPWPFNVGQYLLQGTPYSKAKGKGKAGKINSLSFWIVNTDTNSTIANGRIAEQELTLADNNELSLYPVPTRDEIYVVPGSEKITEVRIISTTGQVYFKADRLDGSKLITISTAKIGLVSGMYFLQAINDKGRIVVRKLIKE